MVIKLLRIASAIVTGLACLSICNAAAVVEAPRVQALFLGDSLTAGGNWAGMFPDRRIVNQGIPSDTSTGVFNRLDEAVRLKPDKLFIMIGVNDLGLGRETGEIAFNIKRIVKKFLEQSPNTAVYVQSLLPLNEDVFPGGTRNSEIMELNRLIRRMTERMGVDFIDLYSPMTDLEGQLDTYLTTDGVHLRPEGYRRWRDAIATYVYE